MKKPELYLDITGPDGNIHFILAMARELLRKQRRITDYNNLRDDVLKSKSYEESLYKVSLVIELMDISRDFVLDNYLKKGKIAYQKTK